MKGNFVQLLDLLIAWLPPLHGIFSREIHPRRAEALEQILVDLEVRGKMRQTPPISGKGAIYAVHSVTRAQRVEVSPEQELDAIRFVNASRRESVQLTPMTT